MKFKELLKMTLESQKNMKKKTYTITKTSISPNCHEKGGTLTCVSKTFSAEPTYINSNAQIQF